MVLHIINVFNATKLNFMLCVFYHNKKVGGKKTVLTRRGKKKKKVRDGTPRLELKKKTKPRKGFKNLEI